MATLQPAVFSRSTTLPTPRSLLLYSDIMWHVAACQFFYAFNYNVISDIFYCVLKTDLQYNIRFVSMTVNEEELKNVKLITVFIKCLHFLLTYKYFISVL